MSVHRLRAKDTEFRMLWCNRSFKRISVKSVPRATWNGWSVGNGMDRFLGWHAWANEESRISLESNYGLSKKAVVGAKSLSSGSAWCFFFHLNILLHQWKYSPYKTIPMCSANLTFHRDKACRLEVVFSPCFPLDACPVCSYSDRKHVPSHKGPSDGRSFQHILQCHSDTFLPWNLNHMDKTVPSKLSKHVPPFSQVFIFAGWAKVAPLTSL